MVRISARTATDARPSPSWWPRQVQLARQPAHGPHQRQRGRSGQLEHDASRRTPKRHGHADLRGRRIGEPPSQHGRRVRWIEGGCPGPDAPSAGGCLNGLFFSSCSSSTASSSSSASSLSSASASPSSPGWYEILSDAESLAQEGTVEARNSLGLLLGVTASVHGPSPSTPCYPTGASPRRTTGL
jgi:hypothetical protein